MKSGVRRLSRSTVFCTRWAGAWILLKADVIQELFDIRQKFLYEELQCSANSLHVFSHQHSWNEDQCAPILTLRRTPSTNCWMLADSITSGWVQCPTFGHRLTSSFAKNILQSAYFKIANQQHHQTPVNELRFTNLHPPVCFLRTDGICGSFFAVPFIQCTLLLTVILLLTGFCLSLVHNVYV